MDGYGQCRNCGATDYNVDAERGECTCADCGCVNTDAILLVASARYKELYDCSGNRQFQAPLVEVVRGGFYGETVADVHAQQREQKKSAPYQRVTYWSERISQWRGLEPSIPSDDFRDIQRLYEWGTNQWGSNPAAKWQPKHCLSKEDTRELLWEIDRQRRARGAKPFFVKKYLEKFLTIRLALCGRGSLGLHINDLLVLRLRELFKQLQVPFAQLAARTRRRHSFISYNFVFRRLFDLLRCSHLGADFPPLKSKKKREDITSIWVGLIEYLQWPYLNSDAALFGASHAVCLGSLNRRSAPRPAAHPKHRPDRLREPHPNSASASHSWGESDAILSDFCAALRGFAGDGHSGASDGNSFGLGLEFV